jgi:hypothetical protein
MKEEDVRQLKELDEAKISKLHWKIVFVSGLGFFTDAYEALRQPEISAKEECLRKRFRF